MIVSKDELELGRERSTELYRQYRDKLLRYAFAYLQNILSAEESVQETFRVVCEKYQELPNIKHPFPWLLQIMTNIMRNNQEDRRRWRELLFYGHTSEIESYTAVNDQPDIEITYAGMISEQDLHLLKLIVVDNCTYLEASQVFHISPEACRKRAKRAIEALRRKLEEGEY